MYGAEPAQYTPCGSGPGYGFVGFGRNDAGKGRHGVTEESEGALLKSFVLAGVRRARLLVDRQCAWY